MPGVPVPPEIDRFLSKPNAAVVATLRRNGAQRANSRALGCEVVFAETGKLLPDRPSAS